MSMAFTANGNVGPRAFGGGKATVGVRGTFASAKAKIQWCEKLSTTDADWFDVPAPSGAGSGSLAFLDAATALTFNAQGVTNVELGIGFVRAVISAATGSTDGDLIVAGSIGGPAGSQP